MSWQQKHGQFGLRFIHYVTIETEQILSLLILAYKIDIQFR